MATATAEKNVEAKPRQSGTKNDARRVRRSGLIPAVVHVDLKRIAMDKALRVSVPILMKGEAPGVKVQGGILELLLREVEIECLPGDIPGHIDADISNLMFGQVLRVSDLPHVGKLKFITDENQPVAHVVAVKEVVEEAPAVEGAEAAAAPA